MKTLVSASNIKLLAGLLIVLGLILLSSVAVPVIGSYLTLSTSPRLFDPTAVAAYPEPIVIGVLGTATAIDYNSPQQWFTDQPSLPAFTEAKVSYYSLSIPGLNIHRVPVEINGADLKKNAIQYPGTALPGTLGNAVVFGHSALPQFYHPANPHTVFNFLPQIKLGEEIFIDYDGVHYIYKVVETQEVKPEQIEVMAQRYDRYELTLITCVPLGTYWRRFVVHAELAN